MVFYQSVSADYAFNSFSVRCSSVWTGLGDPVFLQKEVTMDKTKDCMRMILKFDTGADGFLKMIYVLLSSAIILLLIGGFFLYTHNQEIKGLL